MSDEKKISRARVAEYFRVVCEFLKERGGEAKRRFHGAKCGLVFELGAIVRVVATDRGGAR